MSIQTLQSFNAARTNLELKAHCRNLAAARHAAIRLGALPISLLIQTDTYFPVPSGRLKLREPQAGAAELIAYDRPDDRAVRTSRYYLVPVEQPAALKAALASSLGVWAVVRKRRELLLWHNVRIHLDQVENLGDFVEFEGILTSDTDHSTVLERLERLASVLEIRAEDRICCSYCNLIRS